MKVNSRTQADRSASTRQALIDAARPLFAEHGFGSVAMETIVKEAGVSRGALYHQFADRTDLFAAVFEEVEGGVSAKIGTVVAESGTTDPIEAMVIGADAWLDASVDPEVQRIVLIDAPAVLGWERWREIGLRYGIGLVEALLGHAVEAGRIPEQPLRPLAHVLIGAMDEAALYVAREEDQETARAEAGTVLRNLIIAISIESPA